MKHGLSTHPLYGVWRSIKARCYKKKNVAYKYYGGRGVVVCDLWKKDFKAFYDWAINNGWEKGLDLDKDTVGDGLEYSPEKCKFISHKENMRKTSQTRWLVIDGKKKSLSEWAEISGIAHSIIRERLTYGYTHYESVFLPKQTKWMAGSKNPSAKKVLNTRTGVVYGSVQEAAKANGITYYSLTGHFNYKRKREKEFHLKLLPK